MKNYALPPYIIYFSRLKTFPFNLIKMYSKILNPIKKVTKSNHKSASVILNSKTPEPLDFTTKKEPKNFDSLKRETGIEQDLAPQSQ